MRQTTPAFQEAIARLNDEQRAAVEGVHGPWVVLAGPGTGKTHMLAARIGNILLTEQVEPRNILCLTFTTAGVKAMRDRLIRFIGPPGSRVAVHTFHDFARAVIEEFPALFDFVEWEQMDALDQRRVVHGVIDGLPPKHPLRGPLHEPYAYAERLLWLFGEMAREGWSAEEVVTAANHHVLDLPNIPEYVYQVKRGDKRPGDLKPAAAEQEAKMELLKAAAALYDDYAEAKRRRNLYDYGDQLRWLADALREHGSLRFQLLERYPFVLVDEYQDTNGLQNEILALLAEDENPNLFVVGDDDQSIYGFQGARIEGLRELVERYSAHLSFAVLRANYRSHQGILDAAQHIIEYNETRLTEIAGQRLHKSLAEAGAGAGGNGAAGFADRRPPQVVRYPTPLAQAHYTAERIARWIADGTPAEEIGVIYRQHSQARSLIEALERLGVPYRLQRSVNVFEHPLVVRLLGALGFIAALRGDRQVAEAQAFEFLMSPAIGITPTELFALNGYRFVHASRVPAWRFLLTHPHVLEGEEVPVANPERFRRAAALLDELGGLVDRYPLPTVVQQVAQRTGLLREALGGEDSELALECIDALVRDAHARIAKEPGLTLAGLCGTYDEMKAYAMPLNLVKQADTRPAVRLMTAHSAKGLEFDRVVMYEVTRRRWDPKGTFGPRFTLPPELSRESGKRAKEEENRRLFYVALTRARHEVVLTVPDESASGGGESPSQEIDALLTEGLAGEERPEVDDGALYEGLAEHYAAGLPPSAPLLDPAAARERWAERELTLGAVTQFDRCRVGFYYQYVSETPRERRSVDRFRGAVHATMHEFYRRALHPEELAFMSEEELVALFTATLGRERAGLRAGEFEAYAAEGEAMLRDWYRCPDDPKSLHVQIERTIALTTPAGVPLRGRIDRIDFDAQTTLGVPVDYKFGEPREIKYGATKKYPDRLRELDSREWRQLAFYAILMRDGVNHGAQPRSGKLVYLDARGTQVVEVELAPESVAAFEEELYDAYHAIVDCDDFSGCHEDPETSDRDKMNCAWCAFHYLGRDSATLVTEEVAGLDDG